MRKAFVIGLIIVLSGCKKTTNKQAPKPPEQQTLQKQQTPKENNTYYINAPSGLNYRKKPKGDVLGKFEYNEKVTVIERTNIFSEIRDHTIIKGEWVGILLEKDTVYVFDGFLSLTVNPVYTDVWSKFPLKKMPLVDSTNFDNIEKKNKLNSQDIKQLQLKQLYPNIDNNGYGYEFYPSYQLEFDDFKSIVVNVFKGDHELESILISYDTNNKLKQIYQGEDSDKLYINALVIAYDEIAEGWSRTTTTIQNRCITIIDALYTDTPVIDTTLYHVNEVGDINKVNTKFKNNIRFNKNIKLNTVYTDTIQFLNYNDNYDYFFLEGKKDNRDVALIYNWESGNHKYNFKKNDLIKVTWKMDSTFMAGDGETLYFNEHALDAEKIIR